MKGQIRNMARAGREIQQGREKAKLDERRYVAVRVKKDGTPSKVTAQDLKWNARVKAGDAERRAGELEKLNPGELFTVVDRFPNS